MPCLGTKMLLIISSKYAYSVNIIQWRHLASNQEESEAPVGIIEDGHHGMSRHLYLHQNTLLCIQWKHMASRVERVTTVGIFKECNTRLLSTSREFSWWHLSIQWQHAGELRKERQQLVSLRTATMPSHQDGSRHFNEIYIHGNFPKYI